MSQKEPGMLLCSSLIKCTGGTPQTLARHCWSVGLFPGAIPFSRDTLQCAYNLRKLAVIPQVIIVGFSGRFFDDDTSKEQ